MIESEKLIADIKSALMKVAENLNGETRDKPWTTGVKRALAEMALDGHYKKLGRYVYTSGLQIEQRKGGGEWLYDFCWLDYEVRSKNAKLLSMPLAMECEWGTDTDIADDFQKLILSRAALRVMVFGGRNKSAEKTADWLAPYVKKFENGDSTDRYLLAGFEKDNFTFIAFDGEGKRL